MTSGDIEIRGTCRYHWELSAGLGAEWVQCLGHGQFELQASISGLRLDLGLIMD